MWWLRRRGTYISLNMAFMLFALQPFSNRHHRSHTSWKYRPPSWPRFFLVLRIQCPCQAWSFMRTPLVDNVLAERAPVQVKSPAPSFAQLYPSLLIDYPSKTVTICFKILEIPNPTPEKAAAPSIGAYLSLDVVSAWHVELSLRVKVGSCPLC
ncbi:hypothetical protein BDN72DRAFT_613070 [Pluteus cervinus]|uniref:Uncharacterized protein n=1 Tax=Pluteus cervinus TaxID=181527 RepID=A0ACD3A134_9AGAR|nr:hypothetical protein BDN72DRAFT_613070 [Pluteus cervinus]